MTKRTLLEFIRHVPMDAEVDIEFFNKEEDMWYSGKIQRVQEGEDLSHWWLVCDNIEPEVM
jgi:hypothetical protein